MCENLSSDEIISQLKTLLEFKTDKELADFLSVDKQSIYQYKKKGHIDIQQKIICILLKKLQENSYTNPTATPNTPQCPSTTTSISSL